MGKYSSTTYRTSKISGITPTQIAISENALKTFWSLPILLSARSQWYMIISKKLPVGPYLQKIGKTTTPLCRLCQNDTETLDHFLVDCLKKNSDMENDVAISLSNY